VPTHRPFASSAQNDVAEQERQAAHGGMPSLGLGAVVGGLGKLENKAEQYGGATELTGAPGLSNYQRIAFTGVAVPALMNAHLTSTPSLNAPLQRPFAADSQYPAVASWLSAILEEINTLGGRDLAADGEAQIAPVEQTLRDARNLVNRCATLLKIEPIVDLDERGNIELFFRNGPIGTLFVVTQDRQLHIFGNKGGEKWSARYQLSGRLWQQHLSTMVRPLAHG
jgi:hypothetical protein